MSESATETLRRMLDERGVEWRCYGHENHTWWGEWHAENRASVNGLFLKVEGVVTPEQAIAATLGEADEGCYLMRDGKKFPVELDCGFVGIMPIVITVAGFRYLLEVPNGE